MIKDYLEKTNFNDTGFSYTLSLISAKYKMVILYCLTEFKFVHYNELKKHIGIISHKTLSQDLKELEQDNIIHREVYPVVPPKVEYSLTELEKTLKPVIDSLYSWGEYLKSTIK